MLTPDFLERLPDRAALASELRLAAGRCPRPAGHAGHLPALGARAAVPGRPAGAARASPTPRRPPRMLAAIAEVVIGSLLPAAERWLVAQHGAMPGGAFVVLGLRQARLPRAHGRLRPRPRLRLRRRRRARPRTAPRPLARRHLLRPARPAAGQRAHRQDRRRASSTRSTCGCARPAMPARSRRSLDNFTRYQLESRADLGAAGADPGPRRGRRSGAGAAQVEAAIWTKPRPAARPAVPLAQAVRAMRERIFKEHGSADPWNLKHARGGMVEIEFAAQYLKLAARREHARACARPAMRELFAAAGEARPAAGRRGAGAGPTPSPCTRRCRPCCGSR